MAKHPRRLAPMRACGRWRWPHPGDDGTLSPQVDVVVLRPGYPPALRMKKTYLAGGVLAAFECKLTLTSAYVTRAAATARIIHAMARPRTGTPYDELVSPLVYGLLAHRTALTDEPEQRID